MPEHYFTDQPSSPHDERAVSFAYRGIELKCVTDAGTFSRDGLDKGSALLLSTLGELKGCALDLGCGWGAVAVALAAANPALRVLACDVNERAASLTARNAALNRLPNVTVRMSDGFANIPESFDHIALNPPIRAGKTVVYSLFEGCAEHLTPAGALHVVIRKQQGAESAQRRLEELFPRVERTARDAGFWVLTCRHEI